MIFHNEQKKIILKKNPDLTEEQALDKARKTTIPERVYREKMSDQQGLLVIYLFDTAEVFRANDNPQNDKLKQMVTDDNYDLNIPLVGYALGFPPIEPDPGGIYVKGDYGIQDEDFEMFEGEESEIDESDSMVPDDNND